MREVAELRIREEFASMLLSDTEGEKLGNSIRKFEIETRDPRFGEVGRLQQELRSRQGTSLFSGWQLRRIYSKDDIAGAKMFQVRVQAVFEPAGEECGTKYDESTACPKCGAGAVQVSDLFLDLRRAPKTKDIVTTIANEIIVSQRLAELLIDSALTGFELRQVRHKAQYKDDAIDLHRLQSGREILQKAEAAGAQHPTGRFYVWLNRAENRTLLEQARTEYAALKIEEGRRPSETTPSWYQLIVTSASAEVVSPTRTGIDPFDYDMRGEYRCPLGHVIGLNLLSEVSIRATSIGESDIIHSQQFVGVRRGLLRPRRMILISRKFYNLIVSRNVKGLEIELANLV